MSTIAVNAITDASGGSAASINGYTPSASNMTGRNRIINGAMMIDQRNAGASVTVNASFYTYPIDRFAGFGEPTDGVFTLQQSSTAPAGFTNSLVATVTTADSSIGATQRYFIRQVIEGYNVADMGFGASGASTFTLSFWTRSSLTGTFGGSFMNENFDRAYPFTYTINAANTWEQKTITVTGDTSGTWLKTNGGGLYVFWSIGAGSSRTGTAGAWQTPASPLFGATGQTNIISTNGATFYITGVQLEVGSAATEFEHRLYGQELALCQRYYQQRNLFNYNATTAFWQGYFGGGTGVLHIDLPVTMRAAPTLTVLQPTQVQVYEATGWTNRTIAAQFSSVDVAVFSINSTSVAEGKLLTLSGGSTAPTGKMSSEL